MRAFHNHSLVFHEKMGCIAETKLVWTAVILNGSDASGPFTNGKGIENVYVVYKSFGAQNGVRVNPLELPLAYGPECYKKR